MIVAEGLSVHFHRGRRKPPIRAVDGLDLHVREGDFFALLGENGAGKSTAMHAFLGLVRPTHGSIRVMGAPPLRGSGLFSAVGYLPEEPHYPEYMTVAEGLAFYAALFRPKVGAAKQRELLETVGLAEFSDLRLAKCSKGMKQKFGIAQCLVNEPRLMFLDEPMRGLDPIGVREFRDILLRMHSEGTTIVMNSHILAEVEAVATRVAILAHGKLVLADEVRNLVRGASGGRYRLQIDAGGTFPDAVTEVKREGDVVIGEVAEPALVDVMAALRDSGARLRSCEIVHRSLEDSFFDAVRGSDHA